MFKPFRFHSGLLGWVFGCVLEDLHKFKGNAFRETHLWGHFGWTDKFALIMCLKKLNVSGAFLTNDLSRSLRGRSQRRGLNTVAHCQHNGIAILNLELSSGKTRHFLEGRSWSTLNIFHVADLEYERGPNLVTRSDSAWTTRCTATTWCKTVCLGNCCHPSIFFCKIRSEKAPELRLPVINNSPDVESCKCTLKMIPG